VKGGPMANEEDQIGNMYKVFQRFDTNQNGFIDGGELQRCMSTVGLTLTAEQSQEVLKEMDELCQGLIHTDQTGVLGADKFEQDGELNFEEFYSVLKHLDGASIGRSGDTKSTIKSIAQVVEGLLDRSELKEKWRVIDRSRRTLVDMRAMATSALPDFARLEMASMLEQVPLLARMAAEAKEIRHFKPGTDVVKIGAPLHARPVPAQYVLLVELTGYTPLRRGRRRLLRHPQGQARGRQRRRAGDRYAWQPHAAPLQPVDV
jgi:Ca2+-binding EF-hand superfamily protein